MKVQIQLTKVKPLDSEENYNRIQMRTPYSIAEMTVVETQQFSAEELVLVVQHFLHKLGLNPTEPPPIGIV